MGGRMGKLTGFSDYPIDLGAQWMHGNQSIVGEMVELFQADVALDDTEYMYWFENELIPTLPKSVDIFEKDGLPDLSFADYAMQKDYHLRIYQSLKVLPEIMVPMPRICLHVGSMKRNKIGRVGKVITNLRRLSTT